MKPANTFFYSGLKYLMTFNKSFFVLWAKNMSPKVHWIFLEPKEDSQVVLTNLKSLILKTINLLIREMDVLAISRLNS